MRERIQNYKRRALEARSRALGEGDPTHKAEWLRIAQAWDQLAKACEEIHVFRDQLKDSK